MAGAMSTATRFITLMSGLIAGPAVSLKGSDGVADDRRGMRLGALATVVPVLDDLLRVVPRTTGVREEDRHERAGADGAGEEACKRADAQARNRPRPASTQPADRASRVHAGVAVQMSTTLPYSGLVVASMIPGISRN